MRKNKLFIVLALVIAAGIVFITRAGKNQTEKEITREVYPFSGTIETVISTTGTVLPKNRLEVKPPVNGRVDRVLVQEGEKVKAGQILAWMSSTERAALLDAARGKGEDTLKYWQEVYKAIPLLSPLDGEVIVATTQPAQTVTTSDPIVVLSDHLIVRAQVDETDIGKISVGQEATIGLDAYPEEKIKAGVEHIYYESQTVNNVTIYLVDLLPEKIPTFFRSGMNATVDFKEKSKDNALLLLAEAVQKDKDGDFVLVKSEAGKEPVRRPVLVGMTDDKKVEILSGLTAEDAVIFKSKKFVLPKDTTGKNPFMPSRRR